MTAPLFFAMPGNEVMRRSPAGRLGAELGDVELRAFPDGETYLRFVSDIAGRSIAIICTLDRPNDKIDANANLVCTHPNGHGAPLRKEHPARAG